MDTTVVICTANRSKVLKDTIDSFVASQLKPAREIIVSDYDKSHIEEETTANSVVRVVLSPQQGSSIQRNVAIRHIKTPYTLFLDDDVELAPNFVDSMERLLNLDPSTVAATAFVVADGTRGDTGLSRDYAKLVVNSYVRQHSDRHHTEAYGCNLFVRTEVLQSVTFDERLALYGWMEDFDFACNCLKYGAILLNAGTCVAHLATPSGRTSGLRLGYSQVVNPFYLWRKNGQPSLLKVIVSFWLLPIARNLRRTLIRIPSDRDDRVGRFKGNIVGLLHLARGKVDPSYILKL